MQVKTHVKTKESRKNDMKKEQKSKNNKLFNSIYETVVEHRKNSKGRVRQVWAGDIAYRFHTLLPADIFLKFETWLKFYYKTTGKKLKRKDAVIRALNLLFEDLQKEITETRDARPKRNKKNIDN